MKFALLFVVFVDLLGQGLVIPIVNTLIMDSHQNLLPAAATEAERHFDYGLVIGIFFLSWFLGAAYISRLSDAIGRKKAIMICLFGALIGYILTILSLFADSLWLMILGRAITGFTAGNQPIAQAAMVDISRDDAERARNMGYIVAGASAGLVGGPLIGGALSDASLLGNLASLKLPFYAALICVATAVLLVQIGYRDVPREREEWRFEPLEMFKILWRVTERPIVLRLSLVFFCYMAATNSFYIFTDNYLTSRFGYGTLGTSLAMFVLGIVVAVSSTFLVEPAQKRFDKQTIVTSASLVMIGSSILFVMTPLPIFCYVLIFVLFFGFGIAYPTLLGLYSASVSAKEQGWVMGVSTALFTLGAGILSLADGGLMEFNIRAPFYATIVLTFLAILLMFFAWTKPEIREIAHVVTNASQTSSGLSPSNRVARCR